MLLKWNVESKLKCGGAMQRILLDSWFRLWNTQYAEGVSLQMWWLFRSIWKKKPFPLVSPPNSANLFRKLVKRYPNENKS